MRKLIFGLLLALACFIHPPSAQAQTVNLWCYTGPTNPQWQPCSTQNPLAVNASVSASITGFPGSTQTTGTPIAVTTGGVTGTLPAGTVVVATNVGTTNGVYCKLGASATTSDQYIAPSGGWFAFTVGTNTQLTCITSTSTTTVNMVGGSGLPTGTGGGNGGSGSNGFVAQGSTTSGQTGPLVQCAVTTSAPTYTTTQTNPCSLDTSGNLRVNVTNANANGQATMANSSPVAIASNQSVADPCMYQAKSNAAIGTAGATNVQAVAGVAAKKVYICSLSLVSAAAAVFNVIEGTGAACTTANEAAIVGSTTAANGMPLSANGGLTLGSGVSTVGFTGTAANGVCILASTSVQFGGNLTYVQQ